MQGLRCICMLKAYIDHPPDMQSSSITVSHVFITRYASPRPLDYDSGFDAREAEDVHMIGERHSDAKDDMVMAPRVLCCSVMSRRPCCATQSRKKCGKESGS